MSVSLSLLAGAGWQFFTDSGTVLSGGLVYTYAAGTSTPQTTYTSATGLVANSNPIVLNAAGRVAGEVWLTDGVGYKFVVKTSTGATIGTYDNIYSSNSSSTDALALLAASSGSSLVGFINSGTGATARTVQAKLRDTVSVKDFGAVGDGVTDDTAAIQAAINYCRDNAKVLVFPNSNFRITSTLNTQYDGNYKATNWEFHGGVLVADFSGSVALNITGGASPQTIQNITIQPSTSQSMTGANYDITSHGITITNAVVNLSGTVQNFKGYGVNISSTAANSNTSNYALTIQTCNIGFYVSGSDDNISVCQAWLKIYNCAQMGFFGAQFCNIRQWNVWLYSEANCTAVTSTAAVYVWQSINSNWWIYAEQQNAANEIDFSQTTNTGNFITSARYNKDTYSNSNVVYASGIQRKSYVQTWTPTIGGSTTAGSQTYAVQKGYYVQEGNKVSVWGVITLSAKDAGTAGNLRIFGLPFNPSSLLTGMIYPITISEIDYLTLTAGKLAITLQATPGNNYLTFVDVVSAGSASFTPSANLAANTTIAFSGSYLI